MVAVFQTRSEAKKQEKGAGLHVSSKHLLDHSSLPPPLHFNQAESCFWNHQQGDQVYRTFYLFTFFFYRIHGKFVKAVHKLILKLRP